MNYINFYNNTYSLFSKNLFAEFLDIIYISSKRQEKKNQLIKNIRNMFICISNEMSVLAGKRL